jgi:ubiquinone/menaquinone biosynthesis C-methylase UbiE
MHWPADMCGERILEVGCGAGRFTEILLETCATVVSVDDSSAVEACRANHGSHPRLTVIRANLFYLPFPRGSFDRVFCYGVLQHTPDPEAASRRFFLRDFDFGIGDGLLHRRRQLHRPSSLRRFS